MSPISFPWTLERPENINLIQWVIVNLVGFALIVWLVGKYLIPKISEMLAERRTTISEMITQVDTTMKETTQLRNDYRAKLEGIQSETQLKLEQAMTEADTLRNQILEEAKRESELIVQRGRDNVERERAKSLARMREQFVNDVIGAAQFAATRGVTEDEHHRLMDDFIMNVGAKS